MLGYLTIAAMMAAGYCGGPWWTSPVGIAALALIGGTDLQPLKARLIAVGGEVALSQARLTTLANSALAIFTAFATGRFLSTVMAGFESQLRLLLQ